MRGGVARQQEPAPSDIDARQDAAMAEVRALIAELRGRPGCERTVLELIETEMRLAELRDARDRCMRHEAIEGHLIQLGRRLRDAELAEQAARRPAPRQHKARQSPLLLVQP